MTHDERRTRELTETEARELNAARAAARWVGFIIPLVLTVLGAALVLIWMPRIPDPMAMHWNFAGEADGGGSPWTSFIAFLVTNLVVISLSFLQRVQLWQARQRPGGVIWGPLGRVLPAIVLGTVVLIVVMEVGTTWMQLDLADARTMPSVNPVIAGGAVAGVLIGALAYAAQPKVRIAMDAETEQAALLDLSETEQAVWFGAIRPSKAYLWIVSITLLCIFLSILLMLSGPAVPWAGVWIMVGVVLLVGVLTIACARFQVRIDSSGFEARALLGTPVFRVPAAEVERVEVGHIAPFAEFGGWGLRWTGGGQMGIVMRTGEGIRIFRTGGKSLVVTLDDAETAAAALTSARDRARTEEASS